MASMLLGHWYLNAPGMALAPLFRQIRALIGAAAFQACVCAAGATMQATHVADFEVSQWWWLAIAMRWAFGILGVGVLAWMARETLKVPNTQSATGILYVAVIGAFGGEIVSILLTTGAQYPL